MGLVARNFPFGGCVTDPPDQGDAKRFRSAT
jgi:hypothetical protein